MRGKADPREPRHRVQEPFVHRDFPEAWTGFVVSIFVFLGPHNPVQRQTNGNHC